VDPASHEIQSVAVAGQPSGVAFTPRGVWVSVAPAGVARVDPNGSGVTLTQTVGSGPTAVLPAYGSIWVANHLDGSVSRLDPSTGRVQATISVGEGPNALGAAGGSLWVANEFDDSISVVDPASNSVERTVPVGASAASLAVEGDSLWLAVGASAAEHRGGTMVIASSEDAPPTLDPAVVYEAVGWQILSVTHDGLLAFKKVGGPDGTSLVPNLASALPQVSPDGLSYRFVLRAGVRFSTGDVVRAEDVRRGIERAIALSGDAAVLLGAIDGSGPCHENPETCDLSDSIVIDGDSITIRLSELDTDLPFKLAMTFGAAVPADTPMADQLLDPIPGTGPYTIASADGDEFRVSRNPHFRQWSGAAQPDGFVDAISWRFRQDPLRTFEGLNAGEVDWMAQPPRAEDLASLQAAHPDQVVQSPQPFTVHLGFDVLKPPFDDPRVRQALNYAIDRERVVELLGGPTQHRPTCQVLPPNFQGYVQFCPYTVEPEANVWSAPDVDRARALIRDAGAEGAKVTALVMKSDPFLPNSVEVIRHVVDVMNEIGLDANVSVVPNSEVYFRERVYGPPGTPAHPQVFLSGWIQDYPGASNFIIPSFGCDTHNPLGYCSEALDARIDEAQRLQATDPGAANRAWTAIEHQVVEDALWAPLTNPVFTYAASGRAGNVQVHPQWGLLLSRLWVR
jgi:YVTN family beta-propeller protein